MAAWRRAIELSLGDEDAAKLRSIAQSRTEPAQADQSRRNFCVTNRRNPRLLQKFSSSSGLDLQFATAAKACQHPRHPRVLTPRTPRKRLEPVMIVFATKSVVARRRLTPPQEAAFGIRLSMQCRRTFLTRSMILSTPVVVATPVRRRPRLVSHSCGDVISDQGSRRTLQPLGHGRIPLGRCAIGHRDCGWASPGARHRRIDHVRTLVPAL